MTVDPRIARVIPHSGTMVLLDRILDWDERSIRTVTASHRRANHPLGRAGRLHAVHLCEYGAQAMAVHGGLKSAERGQPSRPGVLVSLRDVELAVDFLQDLTGELVVTATCVHETHDAWQYQFCVTHDERLLARGRATISVRPG